MTPEDKLRPLYERRYNNVLVPLESMLEKHIKDRINGYLRLDRISVRAKSVSRFLAKAQKTKNGNLIYNDPLNEIQDQIGARIVTFYLLDIEPINRIVHGYYAPIEERTIIPESENEFGYEGKHCILFIPRELISPGLPKEDCPHFFELQIKTLFEHAWAEANHDLAYKPQSELTKEQKRKVAFTAAQAWGADLIFDELAKDLLQT